MQVIDTFKFSESEGRKMRRGAFLPLLLIVPLATLFAIDSSKSQPAHFLMTFGMGAAFGMLVVMIGLAGARNRIDQMAGTSLSVLEGKLLWTSGTGKSELMLQQLTGVLLHERGNAVRAINLTFDGGKPVHIEGFDRMDVLAACIARQVRPEIVRRRKWYHI